MFPVIKADGGNKPPNGATLNGDGPHSNGGVVAQKDGLPTVSPGKLRYSKAARKAAFATCRAAVSEHNSCACILTVSAINLNKQFLTRRTNTITMSSVRISIPERMGKMAI